MLRLQHQQMLLRADRPRLEVMVPFIDQHQGSYCQSRQNALVSSRAGRRQIFALQNRRNLAVDDAR
jgi:hypothetical protein